MKNRGSFIVHHLLGLAPLTKCSKFHLDEQIFWRGFGAFNQNTKLKSCPNAVYFFILTKSDCLHVWSLILLRHYLWRTVTQ